MPMRLSLVRDAYKSYTARCFGTSVLAMLILSLGYLYAIYFIAHPFLHSPLRCESTSVTWGLYMGECEDLGLIGGLSTEGF